MLQLAIDTHNTLVSETTMQGSRLHQALTTYIHISTSIILCYPLGLLIVLV